MKILIDTLPLNPLNNSAHKVRGVGMYIMMLINNLQNYDVSSTYIFMKTIEERSQDSNLIHYPYFDPFFLTGLDFKHTKTVITIHDLTPILFSSHFPVGIKGIVKWNINKFWLKKVDAIITDSYSSKKDIYRITGIDEDKIHVVYLAADSHYKKISNKKIILNVHKKYNLPTKFLLYVGDATWNKNLPRLIDAIKRQNLPLVMVGKALNSDDFERDHPWNQDLAFVRRTIKDDTQFATLGFVPNEDLASLYSSAQALLMPSLYEGFGLPILEAMNCGCPVIASQMGSLPEVAGDAAYYVDPYDIDSITEGIDRVVTSSSTRHDMSEKGFVQARKFTIKKMIEDTISVYKKVIKDDER